MLTDPIADMLTRIRNAVSVERPSVDVPLSLVKRGLADVLKREGYIWDWQVVEVDPVPQLRLELKYGPAGEHVIQHQHRLRTITAEQLVGGQPQSKSIRPGLTVTGIATRRSGAEGQFQFVPMRPDEADAAIDLLRPDPGQFDEYRRLECLRIGPVPAGHAITLRQAGGQ